MIKLLELSYNLSPKLSKAQMQKLKLLCLKIFEEPENTI